MIRRQVRACATLVFIVGGNALGAFKSLVVSVGVVFDESVRLAFEGVEGKVIPPPWAGSVFYEDLST